MARPVKGNNAVDKAGEEVIKAIAKFNKIENGMKNLNEKISRDLGRATGHMNTECIYWNSIKGVQGRGGVKGNKQNKKS